MSGFVVVIPARFASQRLPGKPLREIAGRPMIRHVHERAKESGAAEVIVATDDERIRRAALGFGAEVCMTSAAHRSGTERLAEVARQRGWPDGRVVVNLQGDEPLMPAAHIDQCAALLAAPGADIATLASPLESRAEHENPNVVKVIVDARGDAIYFSRAPIPHARDERDAGLALQCALRHHGIYAYRAGVLRRLVEAPPSTLEECEQLEQLRAMTMGLKLRVGRPAGRPGPGVDTEDDLRRVESLLRGRAGA